ncbi:three-Cys-motif partner protein [Devosia lucknowensis]|uniref:Three-Cys-motif partner protein n=1 Tax=Devosia lucknowensis TaxID=1096929 RepID=A0A1Y6F7B2_9HYPH|nr:three-Cys-motif partner protein TcmP [Devosia lucknowensis]SMQ70296.1 three-Cys-motif partner protein [Devosia lucknowensis]
MRKPFRGSIDTDAKLKRLRDYLQHYSIALKDQGFARIYIDAFAGTGSKTETRASLPLFDGDQAQSQEVDTPGSARIALSIDPPFHTLALIEQDAGRFAELQKLKEEFPDRKIAIKHGDANESVKKICAGVQWHKANGPIRGMRGVVFLDPFGMEVEWATVEAIANTQALDCWYFFPLSGLYRNAPHDPTKLDAGKQQSLDRVLGTRDWREKWYQHDFEKRTLFEDEQQAIRRSDVDAIEAYVKSRLQSVFKGLVMDPVRLRHNNGAPMASLFFAVSNPKPAAVALAKRIASYILK